MTDRGLGILALLPLLLLVACADRAAPTPVPTIPVPPTPSMLSIPSAPTLDLAPVGTYDCYGHEAGTLAYTGQLYIRADGTVEFLSRTGRWTFDKEAQTLTFSGDTVLDRAEYRSEPPRLRVDLQPGVDVIHAERGTMSCDPAKQ